MLWLYLNVLYLGFGGPNPQIIFLVILTQVGVFLYIIYKFGEVSIMLSVEMQFVLGVRWFTPRNFCFLFEPLRSY